MLHSSRSHYNSHEVVLNYQGVLYVSPSLWNTKYIMWKLGHKENFKNARMFSLHMSAFYEVGLQYEFDIFPQTCQIHRPIPRQFTQFAVMERGVITATFVILLPLQTKAIIQAFVCQ